MPPFVLHVDLDEFIAAVEVLRRPGLAGKPVIVGGDGDPTKRGVVSTANYEARAFGVRSGMPLRTAARRCPDAVFLSVDAEAYLAASREVMDVLRSFPAVVEVAGWDEAFMAVDARDPEALAREVQAAVLERTRLWSTIGVGDNKLRAKLATGFGKPRGVFRLTRSNWFETMGSLTTDALWGIGRKTARKLEALGIRTVDQLAATDPDRLASAFGPRVGPWLRDLATGEDATPVSADRYVAKGHGRERTFQTDITDVDEVHREISSLARSLAEELAGEGRPAVRVGVKVRFAPFFTTTRSVGLVEPTLDPAAIEAGALAALDKLEALDRPVRLLGVRVELADPEPRPGDHAPGVAPT
jgi:DNA polymerase-4